MKTGFGFLNGKSMRSVFAGLLALAVLGLTGCSTYYGYDDIKEDVLSPLPDGEPRDVRHYAVVTIENGSASLQCFTHSKLPRNTMKEHRIVGRKEFYRDYDAWWYFENSPYNAGWNKDAWLFSVDGGYIGVKWAKSSDTSDQVGTYFAMLIVPPAQIFVCIDAVHFLGVALIDSCLFIGRCCWTGISIPCGWLGGRLFCWGGDWHLAEHSPGPLRMTSYMPFINFFMIQTPPYMTDGPNRYETVKYDADDQTVLSRTRVVKLTPQQKLHARCKVRARVFCGEREYGSREFRTNDDGQVDLTEFLRKCVKSAPLDERSFTLELRLYDDTGKELLARNVDFASEHVMSQAAANDLAACRRSDTDYLNKLLLSRRSHLEWRKEVFVDDLAVPKRKPETR